MKSGLKFSAFSVALAAFVLLLPAPARGQGKKYEVVEVKNGASIAGKVVFEGTPFKFEFPVNKDKEICCKSGGDKKNSPRLVVGADGKVKNAVVFLTEVSKGKAFPEWKPQLDQKECTFEPHVLLAQNRERLKIRNGDPMLHNVHGFLKGSDVFNLALPNKDQVTEVALRRPGIVTVKCDAGHYWMSGFIFVVEHPYYAITDESGAFQLDNIPPGNYTLRVWHEGWTVQKKEGDNYAYGSDLQLEVPVKLGEGEKLALDFAIKEDGKIAKK